MIVLVPLTTPPEIIIITQQRRWTNKDKNCPEQKSILIFFGEFIINKAQVFFNEPSLDRSHSPDRGKVLYLGGKSEGLLKCPRIEAFNRFIRSSLDINCLEMLWPVQHSSFLSTRSHWKVTAKRRHEAYCSVKTGCPLSGPCTEYWVTCCWLKLKSSAGYRKGAHGLDHCHYAWSYTASICSFIITDTWTVSCTFLKCTVSSF